MSGEEALRCVRTKRRDACDKCHDMKSRCHKAPASASCTRCERFGFQCHFSEALKPGRPKKRTTEPNQRDSMDLGSLDDAQGMEDASPHEQYVVQPNDLTDSVELGQFTFDMATPLQEAATFQDDHPRSFQHTDITLEELLSSPLNNIPLENATFDLSDLRRVASDQSPAPPEFHANYLQPGLPQSFAFDNLTPSAPPRTQDSPIERLLALQSTLQKMYSTCSGEAQSREDNPSAKTPLEKTFVATEDLVAVVEDLYRKSISDRTQRHAPELRKHTRDHAGTLSEDLASLLVLSCYVCLLEIYNVQVASLYDQAEDTVGESRFSSGRRSSYTPSRGSTSNSSVASFPTLSIGQFNLGSPTRNISLLVHVTQEMIGRLQDIVQLCSSLARTRMMPSMGHARGEAHLRFRQNEIRRHEMSEGDQGNKVGAEGALTTVFDGIMNGIQSRERQLMSSINEVRFILRSDS